MSRSANILRFWGVRGSVPTPGSEQLGHGGNTSCLSVDLGDDEHIILDAGSGIRLLGNHLTENRPRRAMRFHLFFTHYHFDHVEGLPFFSPLYDEMCEFTVHGFPYEGRSVQDVVETLIRPPYFPVPLAETPSKRRYVTLDGEPVDLGPVRISCQTLNHPDGCHSYRLERDGRRIVYATDHEHGRTEIDRGLVDFARGADSLIYDATYVPAEYETLRRGWGHSTWYEGVRVAKAAGVRSLILFHHHPMHTDAELEAIVREARKEIPGVDVAREGMEIRL